jgi:hypothetical protein
MGLFITTKTESLLEARQQEAPRSMLKPVGQAIYLNLSMMQWFALSSILFLAASPNLLQNQPIDQVVVNEHSIINTYSPSKLKKWTKQGAFILI